MQTSRCVESGFTGKVTVDRRPSLLIRSAASDFVLSRLVNVGTLKVMRLH